jgi:hypothetical protein
MDLAAWFQELRRRRVIRALLGWGLVSFAVLQVIDPILRAFHLTRTPSVTGFGRGIRVAKHRIKCVKAVVVRGTVVGPTPASTPGSRPELPGLRPAPAACYALDLDPAG